MRYALSFTLILPLCAAYSLFCFPCVAAAAVALPLPISRALLPAPVSFSVGWASAATFGYCAGENSLRAGHTFVLLLDVRLRDELT